ncbi:MAG: aldolase/citrate lyase family protein [Thermoleophilia bacterium]|nr:aldolase/citrate lyase family protein [Thermoleophilia bacterium]
MAFKPFLRPNRVLAMLEKGETPLGMQMYTHDPDLVEIVGYAGFDFVMLDMEHNRTNPETMVALIRAAEASGATPLVRVPANDPHLIRAAVESGAQGIFVPHVKTAAEAKAAMEAMRYPPEGRCGICPAIRAAGYAQEYWEEYMAQANRQIMFIPLLEDVEGIENAEEIISLLKPGRDGVGLGLADIACSLIKEPGERVQWQHPYLKEASAKVRAICEARGIPIVGMAWPTPDRAGVEAAKANGTKVILFHPDSHFWYQVCRNIIREVRGE